MKIHQAVGPVGEFPERGINIFIFHLFAQDALNGQIYTKFCTTVWVTGVIACDNFLAMG